MSDSVPSGLLSLAEWTSGIQRKQKRENVTQGNRNVCAVNRHFLKKLKNIWLHGVTLAG